MDTKEILTLISICVTLVIGGGGFFLTIVQINKSKLINKAEFVRKFNLTLRTTPWISVKSQDILLKKFQND